MAQTDLILRSSTPKIFEFLLENKKVIMSEIAKSTNITYSHVSMVLKNYNNLFDKDKTGRCVYINLNKKGVKIAEKVSELRKLLIQNEI